MVEEETIGKVWQADDGLHIDVRGLEAPEPMVAILQQIEKTTGDGPMIVHHFCAPIYLYPELAERGWGHRIVPGGDLGEVRLILRRKP